MLRNNERAICISHYGCQICLCVVSKKMGNGRSSLLITFRICKIQSGKVSSLTLFISDPFLRKDFETKYEAYEKAGKAMLVMKARDVWKSIVERQVSILTLAVL